MLFLLTQPLAPPAHTSSVQKSAPLMLLRAMSHGMRREEVAGHSTSVFIHHCGSGKQHSVFVTTSRRGNESSNECTLNAELVALR